MDQGYDIVFDWDGTLFDAWPLIVRAVNIVRKNHKLAGITRQDILQYNNCSFHESFGHMFGTTNAKKITALINEFETAYLNILDNDPNAARLMPGAEELLIALTKAEARMAVASNKSEKLLAAELYKTGLVYYFSVIVGADTVDDEKGGHITKPDPRLLWQVGKRLGSSGAHDNKPKLVMVGDSTTDLGAAATSGVPAYLVHNDPHALASDLPRECAFATLSQMHSPLLKWARPK